MVQNSLKPLSSDELDSLSLSDLVIRMDAILEIKEFEQYGFIAMTILILINQPFKSLLLLNSFQRNPKVFVASSHICSLSF
jgi:hypothetical protein